MEPMKSRKPTRTKYTVAVVTAAMAATVFAAAPASATTDYWYRDCSKDTKYTATVTKHKATTKRSGGNCQGHAYVRIKVDGEWGKWASSTGTALKQSPVYAIQESQHKDCNCSTANVHKLKP
ncbi:hypothetical protein DY218_00030 [Streptomyces triticagri]|uniref:DUF2690 domain-containing protein n=1 Tax=Streptomyces triticagri TaxID=2293568 RepID=A0A372MEI0_9ACTN|nr:hypothetical protein [Streptomyces triticagri]RFU88737.1 hypothetical protein DY218_00030 [Streptomyces triticagri]